MIGNHVYGYTVPRVRIPLSAPKKAHPKGCVFLRIKERDSKPTVKKCSCGAFLGRSAYETLPKNVNPRFGMIVLL